jgi:hypothetical protein
MAITYPLTFSGLKKPRRQRLIMSTVGADSRSPFTLTSQTFMHPGQLWRAEIELTPMVDPDDARPWIGWLAALDGRRGNFNMGDQSYTQRGTATSFTVTGNAGDRSVSVTMTGTMLAGDYFQLGTGSASRLYMVTRDRSGTGTMEIWPALRSAVTAIAADISTPVGNFKLDQNNMEWTVERLMYEPIIFTAVENI